MSTNEISNVEKIKRTYSGFDANLNEVNKEVEIEFTPAQSYEEAVQRLGSDSAKLLEGANIVLRKEELRKARENSGANFVISREVLMEFIKSYRALPQFASLVSSTDLRKVSAEDWDKQTKAICEQVAKAPFMVQGMIDRTKQLAAQDE